MEKYESFLEKLLAQWECSSQRKNEFNNNALVVIDFLLEYTHRLRDPIVDKNGNEIRHPKDIWVDDENCYRVNDSLLLNMEYWNLPKEKLTRLNTSFSIVDDMIHNDGNYIHESQSYFNLNEEEFSFIARTLEIAVAEQE